MFEKAKDIQSLRSTYPYTKRLLAMVRRHHRTTPGAVEGMRLSLLDVFIYTYQKHHQSKETLRPTADHQTFVLTGYLPPYFLRCLLL